MSGKYTVKMGFNLYNIYKNCRNTAYEIYYDPHKNNEELKTPNSYRPILFFGECCSNASTLGHVDVAVVGKNNEVVLACEVEESDAAPKKIIGDVMSIILSDQISINEKYYYYNANLVFILGINRKPDSDKEKKTEHIRKELTRINKKIGKRETDLILVFGDGAQELTKNVEEKIIYELNLSKSHQ